MLAKLARPSLVLRSCYLAPTRRATSGFASTRHSTTLRRLCVRHRRVDRLANCAARAHREDDVLDDLRDEPVLRLDRDFRAAYGINIKVKERKERRTYRGRSWRAGCLPSSCLLFLSAKGLYMNEDGQGKSTPLRQSFGCRG